MAWAVGDFEYIETFTERQYNGKNIPVRVYTTKGLAEQGRFALKNAAQIVDYFSEVYPVITHINIRNKLKISLGIRNRLPTTKGRLTHRSRICMLRNER